MRGNSRLGLKPQAQKVLDILATDPRQTPPLCQRFVRDLEGACSRRINIQHRPVHQVLDDIKTQKVIHMWTHYE